MFVVSCQCIELESLSVVVETTKEKNRIKTSCVLYNIRVCIYIYICSGQNQIIILE